MWIESIGADVPVGDLFDAVVFGRSGLGAEEFGLEVVSMPGGTLPPRLRPGWLVLGRALGEARLGWAETVSEGELVPSAQGQLVAVGNRGQLRLVSDPWGRCRRDTIVLRPIGESDGFESDGFEVDGLEADGLESDGFEGDGFEVDGFGEEDFESDLDAGLSEVATDPVVPVRPTITLTGSVGRRGNNRRAEVDTIQQRLLDLQYLSAADRTAETIPATVDPVPDARIPLTIAAIEAFQRDVVGGTADGAVGRRGNTLRDLNRAIPRPTAAQLTAVDTQRGTITATAIRGVTITAAVGNTTTGNAAADVTAVQNRLVQLGFLASAHGEAPTGGAAMTAASLPRTIAAIRRFQTERVSWWNNRRGITGAAITGTITNGVVAPGDATLALLDAMTTWDVTIPAAAAPTGAPRSLRLHSHVKSGATRNAIGVMLAGTARTTALALSEFTTLGLSTDDAHALRFVSHHEGNFDALNTYDVARVSVGFIQFAGGRGLRPYLALLKSRQPATFQSRLGQYGIDVEFGVDGAGNITNPRVVVLDPAARRVLRDTPAEEAIRDDKRLSALFVMSGWDIVVQRVQIEAAIRDYVEEAKAFSVSWGSVSTTLGTVIRSQKGRAMMFDRAIHQGTGGGPRQFEGALRKVHSRTAMANVAAAQAREADVLAQVVENLEAQRDIHDALTAALAEVERMLREAGAAGATVTGVTTTAGTARTRLDTAVTALTRLSPGGTTTTLSTNLPATRTRLDFSPAPANVTALRTELTAIKGLVKADAERVAGAAGILRRIVNIRDTTSLTGP